MLPIDIDYIKYFVQVAASSIAEGKRTPLDRMPMARNVDG